MSWIQTLCETYDNYFAGEPFDDPNPLVPAGLIEKELHLRVNLMPDGEFASASALEDKPKQPVPSTPEAEGRVGNPAAYPLSDELRYVAGDMPEYADDDYSAFFSNYISNLRAWCAADDSPDELRALLGYLEQKRLVRDLVGCGALHTDEDGKLLDKWSGKNDKPVFFSLKTAAHKCFVDFAVHDGASFVPLREKNSVRASWQRFLLDGLEGGQLCYADGLVAPTRYNHAKIEGNAKLISSDEGYSTFQYKGRFQNAEQAYSISYLASTRAHNALRWLRERQGFRRYGLTFITWSPACRDIVTPQDAADDFLGMSDDDDERALLNTEQVFASRINSALKGYESRPEYAKGSRIVMLGMEAATSGRMSINYYQELDASEYLSRLARWYSGCSWRLTRRRGADRPTEYVTAPTLAELGEAVFGARDMRAARADSKGEKSITRQIKSFNIEILSCIANANPVPANAARAAFRRACRPEAFTNDSGRWQREEWLKCVAVTCAMHKSRDEKEEFQLALNTEERDRSYLFGRLMAVADCAELLAMSGGDADHRQTNAIRYFSAVQQRPGRTWQNVETRLIPYLTKLKGGARRYTNLLDEIQNKFKDGDIDSAKALSPRFLEGYHCQRHAILNSKKEKQQ